MTEEYSQIAISILYFFYTVDWSTVAHSKLLGLGDTCCSLEIRQRSRERYWSSFP